MYPTMVAAWVPIDESRERACFRLERALFVAWDQLQSSRCVLENELLLRTEAVARHPEDLATQDLYARSAMFTQSLQHLNDDSESDTELTPKRIRTNQ